MIFSALQPRTKEFCSPPSGKRGIRAAFPPAIPVGRFFYSGFTLLEMLLVLFIMGLLASAATAMTDSLDSQARYDDTLQRMERVKRAIAGDPGRTVNGGPAISGFVADMGRLPGCLAELLEPGTAITPATTPDTYTSPCGGSPPATIPAWHQNTVSGVWSGWRGPYLDTVGTKKYHDGYGNPGDASDNYGWSYATTGGVVALSSKGADASDAGDDIADATLVAVDDYEVPLATVQIDFHNRRGSDTVAQTNNLLLRLYSPTDDGVANAAAGDDSDAFSVAALGNGLSVQIAATFSSGLDVPIGARAYAVVCADTGKLYDGDCDAGNAAPAAANVMLFTMAPRAQPTAFDWILQ